MTLYQAFVNSMYFAVCIVTQWDSVVVRCVQENVLTDGEGEGSAEECEVTDECAMLLNAEGGSTLHKVLKATAAAHKHGTLTHYLTCNYLV